MQINFFEEFPTSENLQKLQLIDFEATIFFASLSVSYFRQLRKQLAQTHPHLEAAYWPLLPVSHWISPFAYPSELERLHGNLQLTCHDSLKVLFDLEVPLLQPHLFAKNILAFRSNQLCIRHLFTLSQARNIQVFTAEYPTPHERLQYIYELLGISYPATQYPHTKIVMYYRGMIPSPVIARKIRDVIFQKAHSAHGALQVGLGPIATGIWGTEPRLSPHQLNRDLAMFQRHHIETVVIYRTGGLNDEYLKVIAKYCS